MNATTQTPTFLVTKQFTGGLLKGLTFTELTTVAFRLGQVIAKPVGRTSPFVITNVQPVGATL